MTWRRIHLCNGLLERDGRLLLVQNEYANLPRIWGLPGGRQEERETADATVVREFREETGLEVRVRELAYMAESYDSTRLAQYTVFYFWVDGDGEPRVPDDDEHVRDCRWVARAELASILAVRVVREPLLGHLANPRQRYFGYREAGITIAFADEAATPAAIPPDTSDTAPRRRDGRE